MNYLAPVFRVLHGQKENSMKAMALYAPSPIAIWISISIGRELALD